MELAVGALGACTGCFSFFFSNGQTLRQLLFGFDENKKEFEDKKREVESKKANYEMGLLLATRKKMKAMNDVDNWYSDYKVKIKECDRLVIDLGRNSGRRCCPCKIKLNKKLLKMTKQMTELIDRYNKFPGSMFVDQPLETVEKRSTDYKPLKSMEKNKKIVYDALDNEMVIRLFGMGGVGKTTLMQQINDEMSNSSYFKLVIWVTVSTTFADIKDIQCQIYERLKLEWSEREDNTIRAMKISEYLKSNVDGNVLFIFDDVWGMLDLKAIGIPDVTYGDDRRKCCKIVLTTRDRKVKVIHQICPKDIEVKGLDEDESWILFKINAGIEDNIDDGIKELAENICEKCKGLPLVITVIAKMLHREEEKAIWSETLTFLNKKDASRYIPNLSNDVYIPLRLSYDRLEREDLKIGFLLCSLFPEDSEIAVSALFCYGIGAGKIAESCQRLNACRNIFIHLKNKGLLQDELSGDDKARMHDVIRDVAHFIAKEEFGGFFCNAELTKWISSVQNSSLGMENVLSLDLSTQASTSLKKSFIKKLKELRVLMFPKVVSKTIPVNIKEYFILHNLSVLCLMHSHIKKLDKDFSIGLCNLRVIDFSFSKIDVIRPKVFSNLHNKLEVLHMLMSFDKWQASDEEDGKYVRFAELAELKKLYSLQVHIKDREILSHEYRPDVVFSSVEYFSINPTLINLGKWNSKALNLSNIQVRKGANWIEDLWRKTETLGIFEKDEYLRSYSGDKEFSVVLTQDIQDIISSMCNLKSLHLYDFPSCRKAQKDLFKESL